MRIGNFLEDYKFHPNSVDFRIISSKALEKFKNIQAFNLNEIRNGKYVFDKTRRELLLLKFDLITRVLHEIENLCIEHYHTSKILTKEVLEYSFGLLDKARQKYKEVIRENPNEFDNEFSRIWIQISNISEYVESHEIANMVGQPLELYFSEFVSLITKYCQDSTFSLFELDLHVSKQKYEGTSNSVKTGKELVTPEDNKKTLMVVISNLTNSDKEYALAFLKRKIDIYLSVFNIEKLFIKNMSERPIVIEVLKLLESFDIEIDYTRSLVS